MNFIWKTLGKLLINSIRVIAISRLHTHTGYLVVCVLFITDDFSFVIIQWTAKLYPGD